MDKKMLAILMAAAAVLLLSSFGCKGRQEQSAEVGAGEAMVVVPLKDEQVETLTPVQVAPVEAIAPEVAPLSALGTIAMPAVEQNREKQIQSALQNAGFYSGKIDGMVGPQTKKAIQDFQAAKGLQVDGKVGPKTWAELEEYLMQ